MTPTTRTEYRVVGHPPYARTGTPDFHSCPYKSRDAAKSRAWRERLLGATNVRIPSRQVTETPWTDPREEGE